jgi:hypothetical protein
MQLPVELLDSPGEIFENGKYQEFFLIKSGFSKSMATPIFQLF